MAYVYSELGTHMAETTRVTMFGVDIDALRLEQAVGRLAQWAAEPFTQCRYVVTPNVDHIVMLQHDQAFRRTYRHADLVLADGWPVVLASKLIGKRLPGLVPGSDLTPALFAAWKGPEPLCVFLLGAMPGVAEVAAKNIETKWPRVSVSDTYSPPLGFEYDEEESQRIVERVNATAPDVLVVGVGADLNHK